MTNITGEARRRKPLVTIQLDPDQQSRLDALAESQRTSRSALIRQAVDLLLARQSRHARAAITMNQDHSR